MKIRKITIADIADTEAVERAFAQCRPQQVACCNWPDKFPYSPAVEFRMFHTGSHAMLRFSVGEQYTAARVAEDNGRVWTDSCVEFFIAVDGEGFYNFEMNSIGALLLAHRRSRHVDVEHAGAEVLQTILRRPTLARGVTFDERQGDNKWQMTLGIPAAALFKHRLESWDGVAARANFYKCGDELSVPHFLSWRPIATESPDFHRPEFFDTLQFAAEED